MSNKEFRKERLYPIKYDDKIWKEEDCDDIFISNYHSVWSLNTEGGVYLGEELWVYPDGKIEKY